MSRRLHVLFEESLKQFSTINHCDDLFMTRCLPLFKRTVSSQSGILRSAVSRAGLEHLLDVCVIVVSVCVFKIVLHTVQKECLK